MVHEDDQVARRVAVAEAMAPRYAANAGVAGVLLAGSVARGLADARSDVEVDVYWHRPPGETERRAVVDDAGWEWVYTEVDDNEWADGVRLDGVKVDVSQFTTATIVAYVEALLSGDTEPELQVRATALLDGRALAGTELIQSWRDRLATYPDVLALAMVDGGLPPRPVERLQMLRARDDPVLLTRDLVEGIHGLLDALFAVNRRYVPHPFHKWLTFECSQLRLAPLDLEARIRGVLARPREGVAEFVRLTEETFDLVEEHVPAYDIAAARAAFGSSVRG
jgi:predicted nucleotidyltransferase